MKLLMLYIDCSDLDIPGDKVDWISSGLIIKEKRVQHCYEKHFNEILLNIRAFDRYFYHRQEWQEKRNGYVYVVIDQRELINII